MPGEQTVVPDDVHVAEDEDPRMRVVRDLGVLAMVVGAIGVAVVPFGAERFHDGSYLGMGRVPLYGLQVSPTWDALWLLVGTGIWTGLSAVLFVGGLACLQLRWWARPVLLAWATAAVIVAAGGGVFYLRWLLPPWRTQLAQVRGDLDALATFGIWGLSGTLAVAVLIWLNRADVRRRFAALRADAD